MSAHSRRAKRQRALARKVYLEGKVYHDKRVVRLTASGTTHKLKNSGYLRRSKERAAHRATQVQGGNAQ